MRIRDTRKFEDVVPATCPDLIDSHRSWNNGAKPMKPERIHAEWVRKDGKEWKLQELAVSGPIIKKDGQPSLVTTECQYYRWGRHQLDIPAWLSSAINSARPQGDWR